MLKIHKICSLFLLSILFLSCNPKTSQKEEATEQQPETEAPAKPVYEITEDQNVFFSNIEDGSQITSPVHMIMGVNGMEVEPAGVVNANKGHHHLIVDGSFVPMGEAVPADATHIHYGDGRTETDVELSPGEHTLTLQFADGLHRSYGEKMSATVTVTVE